MSSQSFDYTVADFNYIEHPDGPQRLRLFMPVGTGPFPVIAAVHGGAWCNGDLTDNEARDLALAKAGIAVAALNFRHAGAGYPASSIDINYAIRWLKAHAAKLNLRADKVGISGQSSGGHLAMLAAMRPADPRYAAIPSPDGPDGNKVDASVACVVMQWPVINPLSRYRNAKALQASGSPPAWVGDIPDRHDLYWKTEAAMEEGNPMLILERGEKVALPPALWIQGRPVDGPHDYRDPVGNQDVNEPERFIRNYRKAGGTIEMAEVAQADRAAESIQPTLDFFRRHLT
ncbi:alpha/beta hydrolase [Rhodopila sp.]|jgi:acetyl esterase/lipase|uniref:alpha/beta hydrolase n=1 Tax=Rhodopila sp. TaxID=2480087 RepID=UPI002C57EC78|nr:alpha/beta hydrolase [Rhodopila sp.]HVZ08360.1 alpha/beta hydrolase [Rhodopila sp.]